MATTPQKKRIRKGEKVTLKREECPRCLIMTKHIIAHLNNCKGKYTQRMMVPDGKRK